MQLQSTMQRRPTLVAKAFISRQGVSFVQRNTPPTVDLKTVQITPDWQDSKDFRTTARTVLLSGLGALGGIILHGLQGGSHQFGSAVNQTRHALEQQKLLGLSALIGTAVGAGVGLLWRFFGAKDMKPAESIARERYERQNRVQLLNTGVVGQYKEVPLLAAGIHSEGTVQTPYFINDEPFSTYNHNNSNDLLNNLLLLHMVSNFNRRPEVNHYYPHRDSFNRSRSFRTSGMTTTSPFKSSSYGTKSSGRGFGGSTLKTSSSSRSSRK